MLLPPLFTETFDPRPPAWHGAPILWLRGHFARWAFPASATAAEIDRYLIWLHVYREARALRCRERQLRPAFPFRLRVLLRRLWLVNRMAVGALPAEIMRDIADREAHGND